MDVLLTILATLIIGLYLLRLDERRYHYEHTLEQDTPA